MSHSISTPTSLDDLERRLGYTFVQRTTLEKALAHSSTNTRKRRTSYDFERFEFLGDRVLGLCIAHLLCKRYPTEKEGPLAKFLAALTSRESCAKVAKKLELFRYIQCRGAYDSILNDTILSDTTEALIAAIYLDGGFSAAQAFVERLWLPFFDSIEELAKDPKSALQEWSQKHGLGIPSYTIESSSGPAHALILQLKVSVGEHAVIVEGPSRRVTERMGAEQLLAHLKQKMTRKKR